MKVSQFILIVLILSSFNVYSSDHIDGPITQSHRVADLSDFYAFPTPNKAGFLSLILNTYPIVPRSGHFTDKVTYVIFARKAQVSGTQTIRFFTTSEEIVINCSFITPKESHDHTVTCKTSNNLKATAKYNSAVSNSANDFKLYAGMKSDPFFFYSDFATKAAKEGKILPAKNSNTMDSINVLSIVIEIEIKKLYKDQMSLLAFATEVITQDSPKSPIRILDRIGRPEITNVSLITPPEEKDLRDRYNTDRPFQVIPAAKIAYENRISNNISYYDSLDKQTNWTTSQINSAARILIDDFLVVDMTKPCDKDSFFEIESSLLLGKAHTTCGGRKPTDDIMDTLFTLYISGNGGSKIQDGVSKPSKAISPVFPYLAEPDLGLLSNIKASIARTALGLSN